MYYFNESTFMLKFVFITLIVLMSPISAYAYVDPSAGSMILQMILAGFVGVIMVCKMYWRRLLKMFCKTSSKSSESDSKSK